MSTLLHKWSTKRHRSTNKTESRLSVSTSKYPWSQRKLRNSQRTLPRFGHAAIPHEKYGLLVYGGKYKGHVKKELFAIDTATMTTTIISTTGDLPSQRLYTTMASIGDYVILYGGEPMTPDIPWDPSLYILSLLTKRWTRTRINHQIGKRSGHSMVAFRNKIYIWGGKSSSNEYMNDLFIFHPRNGKYGDWERIVFPQGSAPLPRSNHCSVLFDSKMFVFGGSDNDKLFNDIWVYDIPLKKWACLSPVGFIPSPRHYCSVSLVNGVIYIHGGKDEKGQELQDLYGFKIKNHCWYMFQNMGQAPSARFGHTMTPIGTKLYIIGGAHTNSTTKPDDPLTIYILNNEKVTYPPEDMESSPYLQRRTSSPILPPGDRDPSTTLTMDTPLEASGSTPISSTLMESHIYPALSQSTPIHLPMSRSRSTSLRVNPLISPTSSACSSPKQTCSPIMIKTPTITTAGTNTDSSIGIHHTKQLGTVSQSSKDNTTNNSTSVPASPSTNIPPESDYRKPRQVIPNNVTTRKPSFSANMEYIDERTTLLEEIKARDLVISEMKSKEHWWRTQVEKARGIGKYPMGTMDNDESHDEYLLHFSDDDDDEHKSDKISRKYTKQLFFEQLVMAKTEIRHIKRDIRTACQPVCKKLDQEDRIQQAALNETNHYKAMCAAMLLYRGQSTHRTLQDVVKRWDQNDAQAIEDLESDSHKNFNGMELYETQRSRRITRLEKQLDQVLQDNEATKEMLISTQEQVKASELARQMADDELEKQHRLAEQHQAAYDTTLKRLYLLQKRTQTDEQKQAINVHHIEALTRQLDFAQDQLEQHQQVLAQQSTGMIKDTESKNGDESSQTTMEVTPTISSSHQKMYDAEKHWKHKTKEQHDIISSLHAQLAEANHLIRSLHSELKKSTSNLTSTLRTLETRKIEIDRLIHF
ncbi:uncharacterized protein BX664DRAFT_354935 [Halteromyces radiatus]|uniref:uncharacterized protein n=1 Tax=Halteromyces radiatus TaxID=101107 RepID=UPI00221F242C|nr:uncharacterized protein BX664DRAFT_354935 [Halteromyces radiatus]KAI8099531.1 hypothetical protein BX664DRAFT_354935 [Halteromyces radiatus]